MQEGFGKIKFHRIVSIGKLTSHPNPATQFLCAPCEVEIELNGVKSIKEFIPNIRQIINQSGRRGIGREI